MAREALITGSASGIGKALHEALGGVGVTRENSARTLEEMHRKGTDTIIHCAFSSARSPRGQEDLAMTHQVLRIPHRKFIYFSSSDVYPKDGGEHGENEPLSLEKCDSEYATTKLECESLVKSLSSNTLILRPTSMLGRYSRENNLIRLIKETSPVLTLTADSSLNLILHEDVVQFIKISLQKDLRGTYNLGSTTTLTLAEAAELVRKQPLYGTFRYTVAMISNAKAAAVIPELKNTSRDALLRFLGR